MAMKKAYKTFIFLLIIVAFCVTGSISYSYAGSTPPIESTPPSGIIKNATPIGGHLSGNISRNSETKNIFYTNYFDGVYHRCDGYRNMGIVEKAGPNNTDSSNSATFTITKTISNDYNVSIGISADFISAHVGYDVTYSTEKSWSYTVTIPPHKIVTLYCRYWYHVQEFKVHRHYWLTGSNEYGTGWAAQWYYPQFYTSES